MKNWSYMVMYGYANKAERLLDESHAIDVMHLANTAVPLE